MSTNPPSVRFPFNLTGKVHPEVDQAIRYSFNGLLDINQAIAALNNKVAGISPTITNIINNAASGGTNSSGVTPGSVNNQIGATAYTLQQTDFGALVILAGSVGTGTTYSDIQLTSANWSLCYLPSCNPGGSGTPVSFTQSFGANSVISIVGPAYSNGLAIYKQAITSTAQYFYSDFDVVISSLSAQAYEFDMFKFIGGVEYMFGTQCNINLGFWQVWDQLHGAWVNTTVPASTLQLGATNHVQWACHIEGSDMSFDTLTINDVPYAVNMLEPSGPTPPGWTDAIGIQFQTDEDTSGTSLSMTISNVNFTVADSASAGPTVTLNSAIMPPFYAALVNFGPDATINPDSGLINGVASWTLPANQFNLVYFDGTNWWVTPLLPVDTPPVAHQWIDSYNPLTGILHQSQPAASDLVDSTVGAGPVVKDSGASIINVTLTGITRIIPLGVFANNAAAIAGGLVAGDLYRTGANPDLVAVVH